MKLGWKPIEKRIVEELKKEKLWNLILAILCFLVLVWGTFVIDYTFPWWFLGFVLFIGAILRYYVAALALAYKKELKELKDKIEKSK